MKKPHVLMLGWEFPPLIHGGLGVACHELANHLSKLTKLTFIVPHALPERGSRSFTLTGLNKLYEDPAPVATGPSKVFKIPSTLRPYQDPAPSPQNLYGPNLAEEVARYSHQITQRAEDMKFDLIHAHDWMTFPAALALQRRTKKPLVLHLHSLSFDRSGPDTRDWVFEIEKEALAKADLVIPVSKYTAEKCLSFYQTDPAKIHPVHNGVSRVQPFRIDKRPTQKVVLFLGRLTRQKGPSHFLKTASILRQSRSDVRFIMAGTGDQFEDLTRQAITLGLQDHVQFTGFLNRQEIHRVFAMTDVYCMPSVSEPFGLSALEAAQFGIPLVLSRQSGVAEVLPEALLADHWDHDLMARHINELLDAPGEAGPLQRSTESLTWENAARKIRNLYEILLT